EAAGCKGWNEGPVEVSGTHANFFENSGGGTAGHVKRLVDRVVKRVDDLFDVELHMEVRRWE
ncbi:MAG: UDP-N-acetylenolpyruvoylglucosamine reductase, partial [Planctomycetota bacterium]|nr:UDP-N-acetylenolpyruvoylglucosamine reductase [Planctomycetota bacterium]